mgnify:CR=1 FL=1
MKDNIILFSRTYEKQVVVMCKILEKIKDKSANDLLLEYEMSLEPPIDIFDLVQKIGITVLSKDFSEIEKIQNVKKNSILGAAFSIQEDLAIFYKESDSLHRRNFTIAHELAHCCFDCPSNEAAHIEYRINSIANLDEHQIEKEKRANIFAGELLIPEVSLRKIHRKMIIPSLTELARIFDVSTSVMAARLDYLRMPYYKDSITEIML